MVIEDYDPAWPALFEILRGMLAEALGETAVAIEHIGSTAVPGLAAKPIIDIDVGIRSLDLPLAIDKLAAFGYVHAGDQGIPGREAFKQNGAWPAHHLYVCPEAGAELRRHLAFRDLLRSSHEVRQAYEELKKRLAHTYRNDRLAYTEAKSAFILDRVNV